MEKIVINEISKIFIWYENDWIKRNYW
jgi:hypothetical protein